MSAAMARPTEIRRCPHCKRRLVISAAPGDPESCLVGHELPECDDFRAFAQDNVTPVMDDGGPS